MRILLRHQTTGYFYCGPDRWSADKKKASEFASRLAARLTAESIADLIEIYEDYGEREGKPVQQQASVDLRKLPEPRRLTGGGEHRVPD